MLDLMRQLRTPETGCPWDIEQTFATIAPHTIEEAYEVAEAIEADDRHALKDELGDLLLQVVFHSQIASEEGSFGFQDVAAAICDKLVRRHPHVFGDTSVATASEQTVAWEALKAAEREAKAKDSATPVSALDGVSTALPAMTRALKLQNRAARVGFDWERAADVVGKIEEELAEVQAELGNTIETQVLHGDHPNASRLRDEIGDLLFSVVNLARKVGIDPEGALRSTNRKFDRRFRLVEQGLGQQGKTPDQATLAEMEALWKDAKLLEKP
ncbi:nucleoside triphosphate pyrophosphohydrolase [Insolitispirillum peregrinum]|uniref:nucleoside triphosphate pyrophosphohydrolase n=1 Tax=Insolitispirillum peregrinum TaxID=80876 RepID=UPI003A935C60